MISLCKSEEGQIENCEDDMNNLHFYLLSEDKNYSQNNARSIQLIYNFGCVIM